MFPFYLGSVLYNEEEIYSERANDVRQDTRGFGFLLLKKETSVKICLNVSKVTQLSYVLEPFHHHVFGCLLNFL